MAGNGAEVSFDQSEMMDIKNKFNVIIAKGDSFQKYEKNLSFLGTYVVPLTWIKSCLLEEKYINPKGYDLRTTVTYKPKKGKFFPFLRF